MREAGGGQKAKDRSLEKRRVEAGRCLRESPARGLEPQRVQFSSVAQSCGLFATPWNAARQASLSVTNSLSCSSHLLWSGPLLLPSSIFPSTRVFSNE